MLGEFSRQDQPHARLNLPTGDCRLLVILREPRRLLRQFLENINDETVHYPHGVARDSDIRMHLLQDFVDVDLVGYAVLGLFLLFL